MSDEGTWGSQSMTAPLVRVMVCPPAAAGWSDPERRRQWCALGYRREPDPAGAEAEHAALVAELIRGGAEVVELAADAALGLDAVYVHDPWFPTDRGAIVLAMGKPARAAEPAAHRAALESLGGPILGALEAPATAEGGDLVWLDRETVLAGRGYRTNAAGIAQLRALIAPLGTSVIEAPLPHGGGPEECLHLMSLLSLLDERTALVDRRWLAVATLEELSRRGWRLLDIAEAERETLACNVLALGDGRLLALAENPRTNARLAAAGFDVRTVPGAEVGINGGGGPTCLTRPLHRRFAGAPAARSAKQADGPPARV